jgi:cell wall-associated NlpC family hydrolase
MRAAIVAEALTWLGTPYHHAANVKAAGVDCAMLLVEVFRAVGLVAPDFDPRPYPRAWYLHRDEERFMGFLLDQSRRTDSPQAGDVAMFRFGRTASHGAIIIDELLMIHAYQPAGRVELVERRAFENRLHSYWTVLE